MDVILERILSLIPKKENGTFVHGAKKQFASSLGYTEGNIVSMWESGKSESYKTNLHEISAKYNVSVEWLRGETDEKTPTHEIVNGPNHQAFYAALENMDHEQLLEALQAVTDKLKEKQGK